MINDEKEISTNVLRHLIDFKSDVSEISLPKKFTFPFYYEPHPLAVVASEELQDYLLTQKDWEYNFGLEEGQEIQADSGVGKMFGVLVVKTKAGKLGYLAAFSGKLANTNDHKLFVPPVFDILKKDGFYKKGEQKINQLNKEVEELEKQSPLPQLLRFVNDLKTDYDEALSEYRVKSKIAKKDRDKIRKEAIANQGQLDPGLEKELVSQSISWSYNLKKLHAHWKEKIETAQQEYENEKTKIKRLKEERKQKSAQLQREIFDHFHLFNQNKEKKSLTTIFDREKGIKPPAGAGECAAPKLLQYAFQNELELIAMAEFWWGKSPLSEIRKHKQYYPACKSKCEPILGHMLSETKVDDNPFLLNPAEGKKLKFIYEDDDIIVINKPEEFLSVPGKTITDSVLERLKKMYPKATGPLLLHRLDMSTSGILIAAKNEKAHTFIQQQFIDRKVSKRYVALLDGELEESRGRIELPLRVDLDDRPRQLVCYEHGKNAVTDWKVIAKKDGKTKVYFYPITGRTHQLRVHASHPLGLNCPIVGDDLYGRKSTRLHLHAAFIRFEHPTSREIVSFKVKESF